MNRKINNEIVHKPHEKVISFCFACPISAADKTKQFQNSQTTPAAMNSGDCELIASLITPKTGALWVCNLLDSFFLIE